MSMANNPAAGAGAADPAALLVEIEMEMMTDMFNKIGAACHKKCISSKYRDGDLTKGEAICLDRCVAKWTTIHEQIGQKLMSMEQKVDPSSQQT